jgi:hypothetical protein
LANASHAQKASKKVKRQSMSGIFTNCKGTVPKGGRKLEGYKSTFESALMISPNEALVILREMNQGH